MGWKSQRARAMRYFFDIRDDQLIPDEEGMILPDIEAAQEEAMRTLTDLVREARRGGFAGRTAIEVRSQHGPVREATPHTAINRQVVSPHSSFRPWLLPPLAAPYAAEFNCGPLA